ncbi:hypothetical protein QBC37DRAFT_62285 [Rhypophila decipiens]|uniref:Telomeric single stranded DNA binding POT1/Cdc13 domain-containing protein n=1 Tax=Rhypophila decipiens TaxID=261697 RepID=A0AAN7BDK6_9PEZI|nr:hypothetical protein QBC37DRAFT_62285 [Rhypophila decipiens]
MASLLVSRTRTPIAQLNPELPDQAERVVGGEVTITWPYNSVTKTTAFLLAESDILLRRAKGQVRVELHGPSAKEFSSSGIGAGDVVLFSLDGVEWAKDESPGRVPGARLDWQLLFDQRFTLEAKLSDSDEARLIDIDHPQSEPEPAPAPVIEDPMLVEPELPILQATPLVRKISDFVSNEYPSPAFMKRARLSYGSLFEGGLDIFEEDGGVVGKGRKRSRFGRNSGAWRYSSKSPSPAPETPGQDSVEEDVVAETRLESSPKPQMTDEGCQTTDFEFTPSYPALAKPAIELVSGPFVEPVSKENPPSPRAVSPAENGTVNEGQRLSPEAADSMQAAASSLFAISKPINSGLSMFGTKPTVEVDKNVNIADQVRFGFSHFPEATESPVVQQDQDHVQPVVAEQRSGSGPAKFTEMESYVDAAVDEMETVEDHPMSPQPPAIEDLDRGRWGFHTESSNYNSIEGGHYDANALIDGTMVGLAEESRLHSDSMQPEMVPDGFHSYGTQGMSPQIVDVDDAGNGTAPSSENDTRHAQRAEAEGGDREDGRDFDEGGYEIEEGDYDQRKYNVPADDDEGLSEENDELEQETAERYGEGDVFSEDEEQDYDENGYPEGEFEEDGYGSEGYDESEIEYEGEESYYRQSPGAVVTAAPRNPVVISLLSDSEDEDEPPAPPPKKASPDAPAREEIAQDDEAVTAEDETMTGFQAAEPGPAMVKDDEATYATEAHGTNSSDNRMQTDRDPVNVDNITHETSQSQESAVEFKETNGEPTNQSPTANNVEEAEFEAEWDKEDDGEGEEKEDQEGEGELEDFGESEEEGLGEVEDIEEVEVEEVEEVDVVEVEEDEEEELADEKEEEDEEEVLVGPSDEDELILLSDDSESELESQDEMDGEGLETSATGGTASPDLGNDFTLTDDEEETDKENMAPDAPEDDSEAAEEIFAESKQVATAETDMEIIEVDDSDEVDSDAGQPVGISEADSVRTPMDVEEADADAAVDVDQVSMEVEQFSETAHIDSEMKEGFAQPDSDNESVMEIEPSDHEIVPLVSGDAAGDDAVMADMPSDGIVVELHSALDGGESKDDYMPVSDTELARNEQETSDTSLKGDQPVGEELSKVSETITNDAATEHPPMGPSTPPLTQPADVDNLDMDNQPHTPKAASAIISNKNERPLPLMTPTQSFIATETVSQVSVTQEHVGPDLSSQVTVTRTTHISTSFAEIEPGSSDLPADDEDDVDLIEFSAVLTKETETVDVEETHEETQETSLANDMEEIPSTPAQSPSPSELAEHSAQPEEQTDSEGEDIEIDEHGEEETSVVTENSFTSPVTRSQTKRSTQTPKPSKSASFEDDVIQTSPWSEDATRQLHEEMEAAHSRKSASPDITISLARQSVAAKRSKKGDVGPPPPVRSSPYELRARSNSVRGSLTPEVDEEDPSISIARAAVASPSKQQTQEPETEAPTVDTAALKAELTKGLRKRPECVSLRNMKNHVDKHPNIVGIVASTPTTPLRAKGGPREYMMAFDITDPTIAPLHVVEVQLYRPHKESLPIVKIGDAILLRQFQIKSISKKGFGLRSAAESAWAVYEEVLASDGSPLPDTDGEEMPPQIKGPPVEDYEEYSGYMTTLKAWYRSLDDTAHGKLERAVKKFEELGVGSSQSQK